MSRPAIEVADIVRAKGSQFLERFKTSVRFQVLKAFRAVLRCRTAALGGHRDKCVDCQYEAPISFNSGRSRCCPKCRAPERRRWLEAQQRDLVNTNCFHVVFTVPHELNPPALTTPRRFFDLLFEVSSPDPAGGSRRSQTAGRRDWIPLHPAYVEFEPAEPSPHPLCRSRRRTVSRPPAMDPHQPSAIPAAHSRPAHCVPHQVPRPNTASLPQGTARLQRSCGRFP